MSYLGRWTSICGLGFGSLACSSAATEELPALQPICDGSDDIRLLYTSLRGFANYGSGFSEKYGSAYLMVNGRCEYWLGSDTLRGLRVGSLDAEFASALSSQIHFGRYSVAADYRDEQVCTDAGAAFLRDTTGSMTTSFCEIHKAPDVVSEAFSRVSSLLQELEAVGEPVWEKSTLLALHDPALLPDRPLRPAAEWTAALDLDLSAADHQDLSRGLNPDGGVLIEDEPTQALLGQLRSAELSKDPYALDMRVRDPQNQYFLLLVRDEPPDAVAAALVSLLALK